MFEEGKRDYIIAHRKERETRNSTVIKRVQGDGFNLKGQESSISLAFVSCWKHF